MQDNTVLRRHVVRGLRGPHTSSLLHRWWLSAQARPGGVEAGSSRSVPPHSAPAAGRTCTRRLREDPHHDAVWCTCAWARGCRCMRLSGLLSSPGSPGPQAGRRLQLTITVRRWPLPRRVYGACPTEEEDEVWAGSEARAAESWSRASTSWRPSAGSHAYVATRTVGGGDRSRAEILGVPLGVPGGTRYP